MNEADILKAVDTELDRAESFVDVRIAHERALAYDYYYGREFGNEVEGRSRVVSADVAQAVDSAVPAILKIFVSGDQAVEFTPRGPEDVKSAEQATVLANYVFFTQNNGYSLAQQFIKDGLLQKTGCFKWKWEESISMSEKEFQGLNEMEFAQAASQEGWEPIAHTQRPDPRQGTVHDVKFRIKKKSPGKVKIIVPPPEEIRISPDATELDVMEMPFIAHTPLLTASDLVQMGVPLDIIKTLPKGDTRNDDLAKIAREELNDNVMLEEGRHDDVYRYDECYIRLDEDGDGIAELRKICKVGKVILHDEIVDHIPIAIWTPKVMPHEVVGISLADDVMDLQLLKSTLWRGSLDSLYLSIAPRMFVQGEVNMDDVLTVKPGGVIRGGPGSALTPIDVPFVGQHAFPMLEYTDQEKDARVGFSAMGPGLDPDSINKTATYVNRMTEQTNARADIIARNAAEFGFKPLFKGIMYLLAKHQQEQLTVRLMNEFVPIDPETWNKEYDMTCNVGLGMGSKDQQLMQLQAMGMDLQMIGQSPFAPILLDASKVYNYFEKKANLAGFKDATIFLNKPTEPDGSVKQPPPPPEPPQVQVAKIKAETDAQQSQLDASLEQQKSQQDLMVERLSLEMKKQYEMWKAELDAMVKLRVGEMQAQANAQRPVYVSNDQ